MRRLLIAVVCFGVVALAAGSYYWWRLSQKMISPDVLLPSTPTRDAMPVPTVTFTDVTIEAGIRFVHKNGSVGQKLLPETMGGGVAVLDYDRDGKPDLLLVSGCPWPGSGTAAEQKAPCLTLYRNTGDGTFADTTQAAGLDIVMYGMGICVGDFDNDGYDDFFVSGVGGNKLFRNSATESGRGFTDVTESAGVGESGWPGSLASEAFTRYATPIPFGSSATFFDYDRDGKLDLFICHYVTWSPAVDLSINASLTGSGRSYQQPQQLTGSQCRLYQNLGEGKFRDVTVEAGVKVTRANGTGPNAAERPVAKSLAVAACDPDGDGYPDILVANDTVQNFYFRNLPGPNATRVFREVGEEVNAAYADGRPRGAMGVDFAEYKPGFRGAVIANFANEPVTFLTPLDRGGRILFTNKALAVGLEGQASRGPLKFGALFLDYDLDGRLDLLLCNGHLEPDIAKLQAGQEYEQSATLFWNTGGEGRLQFEPVPPKQCGALATPIVGRGCATLDYDGDGDLDIVLVANGGPAKLIRNDQKLNHHFVRFQLVGDGVTTNTSAIGAQLTIEAGSKTYQREVTGARGYLSQSENIVTLGLGEGTVIDKVSVRWPGGPINAPPQVWTGLAVDRTHILRQGK